jgi:hypothetical protein
VDDPGTSALLRNLISANPYPDLDPCPSHSPEPEPQRTEPLALTESEPAAPERYISSQDQSSPLQPLSVAQQSATAGEDDKPPRLYPLFYRHHRGVGVRGGYVEIVDEVVDLDCRQIPQDNDIQEVFHQIQPSTRPPGRPSARRKVSQVLSSVVGFTRSWFQ